MILTILGQQWKAFWRSRNVSKSLAMRLIVGFGILYLLTCCLMLGILLPDILRKSFPGRDIIRLLCSILLYYYMADLALRYLIQDLPALAVRPYLTLNIRRRQLVTFLNIRSLFHFVNLLPIILFFPFIFDTIAPADGPLAAWALAFNILLLTLTNHSLLLYMKRKTILNAWWLLGFLLALGMLILLDYLNWLPVRRLSATAFLTILQAPLWTGVTAGIAAFAFTINRRSLLHDLYLEELTRGQKTRRSVDYSWLRQLGAKGDLMALDLKLILRAKRPRYLFILSLLFPIYGFLFFQPRYLTPDHLILSFLACILVTGLFIGNYGQWVFGWQSVHFDGLLSANIDIATYIRSKLLLFTSVSTIEFIISSPFGLVDWHFLLMLTAAWLYNIGCSAVLVIWIATFNYEGVDLNAGRFSRQGSSVRTMIHMVLIQLFPILLYQVFKWLHMDWTGIVLTGAIGLLSLSLRTGWVNFLVREFNKRKYLILQGFRDNKH